MHSCDSPNLGFGYLYFDWFFLGYCSMLAFDLLDVSASPGWWLLNLLKIGQLLQLGHHHCILCLIFPVFVYSLIGYILVRTYPNPFKAIWSDN